MRVSARNTIAVELCGPCPQSASKQEIMIKVADNKERTPRNVSISHISRVLTVGVKQELKERENALEGESKALESGACRSTLASGPFPYVYNG